MELKKYLLSLYVLYSFSCFSAPPQWIDDRPSNSEYWHGIGFVSYSKSNDPKMLAREYAIHEISSQIKINIHLLRMTEEKLLVIFSNFKKNYG